MPKSPKTFLKHAAKGIQSRSVNPAIVRASTILFKTIQELRKHQKDIALYFYRSKIPHPREHHFDEYKGHLGIYGFSFKSLEKFCQLSPAPLEDIEKLEQLRALYHGYDIAMKEVQTQSFGVDTPQDLERALKYHIHNFV